MTRNLDISLLRAFVAVVDQRSMTLAAQVLHLTQGAISQQIARLEDLMGGALLSRDRQGVRLTSHGDRHLGRVRQLISLHDEILAEVNGHEITGSVRLGVSADLVTAYLAPVLKSFTEACPQVDVSLACASSPDLMRGLAAGQLDLAVLEEPADAPTGECLRIERLAWVGARGGKAHVRTPLPVCLMTATCAFRPAIMGALRRERRVWRTMFEAGSIDAMLAVVRTDLAITACLATIVPADVDVLPPETGLPHLPLFAISLHLSNGRTNPATSELARHVRSGMLLSRQVA